MANFYHERWPVFYEDNHLFVLYKPAGLIMQRDYKNKVNLLDLAKTWIKNRYQKPGNAYAGMVHRLDGPVAGLVVLARTSKAASRLSAQIRQRTIEKHYLAVVEGRPPKDRQRLKNRLVRQGRKSRLVAADLPNSRLAILEYRVLAGKGRTSALEIRLETGRRHQIRVQLAGIGTPIIGDVNYGATRALPNGRIALLARRLAFDHPTQARRMEFEVPTPERWPWPPQKKNRDRPLWAIEDYGCTGLKLPEPILGRH